MIATRPRPMAGVRARAVPASWLVVKRGMDVTIAGVALVGLSPLVALAAIGIVCASPGSPFFLQERVGKDGRPFKLFKLRTMFSGAHLDHDAAAALLAPVLEGSLAELSSLTTADLLAQRYDKFRHMGQFFAPTT